ncbi:putative Heat shock protein [Taphrina deformans PYCC 5710]|uniref:Heat shock protein n=1 Tax=Taphrina deformans (strain PYCC 5710 / ATCC 11124 / CBS 356.35 / IMI 108563 / JCM 9778 / NBRC 8474) TaxID=1097556 RepID=R4XEK6_TAPDE|nr:putative Heat shock protein [Taphrina deformans PYCC 5710]|eukprot:CCG82906.1 putative Heat shock protein [Taphrina deformans PYCC 5710]
MSAAALKAQGNTAFAAKDFPTAIDLFTKAIEVDASNHVLYSNRSACHASLKHFDQAVKDADKCIELKGDWAKGYSRKGAAMHGLGDLQGAVDAYEKCLELDPSNAQAKSGMESVDAQMKREMESGKFGGGQDPFAGFAAKLSSPDFYKKMSENPQTSKLLGDGEFMRKLEGIKRNPQTLMQEMNDPRMISILGLLLGQDIGSAMPEDDVPMPDAQNESKKPEPKKAPEPEPESEPVVEEEDEDAKAAKEAKSKADAEKALGNAAYKSRSFDEAIKHYTTAYELHKDITYLTNKAAAHFEAGDYDSAIQACQQAIEQGREVRADFKVIAKAFARIGSSYEKKGDLQEAINNYNRSLTEHRTADTLAKLKSAETTLSEKVKKDYESPELAEEARVAGNDAFKASRFPDAVKQYTEMTKRAPMDARGYANRAAAYIKLMSMPEAIKDCDKATALDPSFVKAYIRKATALLATKDYSRAQAELDRATQNDADGKHRQEIQGLSYKIQSALYDERSHETEEQTQARIANDPEVRAILEDPVMQSILQQAQQNPASLNEHMKNPQIGIKIQKLVDAGVIKTRR